MNVLILGGTLFLGKHLAEQAVQRGMEITLFNRGKTNPTFLQHTAGVTHLIGDRGTDDSKRLTDQWDVVIDVAGRDPEDVRRSVDQLKDRCKMYVYISSVSAYKNLQSGPVLESDALHELDQDDYASNKATSEVIVNETFYDRSLIIRPGLIVGPDDSTDRFTYWPWRMKQGGNVLVPNVSENKDVQFIDVRDLSTWILQLIEQGQTGTFNATGPQAPLSFRSFLERCQELVAPQETKLCWVNEETLQENDVQPWIELPFWLPDSLRMNGLLQVNSNKAIAAGLTYRSLDETIIDTLNWSLTKRTGAWQAGMSLEKESQLLMSVPPMK